MKKARANGGDRNQNLIKHKDGNVATIPSTQRDEFPYRYSIQFPRAPNRMIAFVSFSLLPGSAYEFLDKPNLGLPHDLSREHVDLDRGNRDPLPPPRTPQELFHASSPEIISRGETIRAAVGERVVLPCQVKNLGKEAGCRRREFYDPLARRDL